MKTHRLVLFAVVALTATVALAQTPQPAPAAPAKPPTPPTVTAAPPPPPPAPPAPGPPRRDGQPINIRVDTTISEAGGNAPPVRKTVTAVAGDGFDASVRETTSTTLAPGVASLGPTSLNVDASPTILSNGKIRVRVTLQYVAGQSQTTEQRIRTDIRQTLVLNLENGQPLVISEASDPLSDRRVTVEVTATVLR